MYPTAQESQQSIWIFSKISSAFLNTHINFYPDILKIFAIKNWNLQN